MSTCPKCGAEYNGRAAPKQHDYWCGSTTWNDGDFYQSPECVRRERDQLLERIERLKEALGTTLTLVVGLTPIAGNKDALQAAMNIARSEQQAKEAKP